VCVRVRRYTMSKQYGNEWPSQGGGCGERVRVHKHTMQTVRKRVARPGRRMQRVCKGYTSTLGANSQVELKRERVARQVRRMQRLCTSGPVHYEQTVRLS
jgi:xanthine/CO dehydrogenase XdhC/CoxF family maturation factor